MPRIHRISHGECLAELSFRHGHADTTPILRADENTELFSLRTDPNALHPGDRVFIPGARKKDTTVATEARHRFRRLKPRKPLRLRFGLNVEDPFEGCRYVLQVWGGSTPRHYALVFEGTLNSKGGLLHDIPLQADTGEIEIWTDGQQDGKTLRFGLQIDHLSPHDSIEGAQARLDNLGYDVGPINGVMNERTSAAIRRFQASQRLGETGSLDQPSIDRIKQLHGC